MEALSAVPLHTLVDHVFALCMNCFQRHGIQLEKVEVPEELMLERRSAEIQQVFLNLLNNTYDAVEPLTQKWIQSAVTPADGRVVLSVPDSGPGIGPQPIEQLMKPFFATKAPGKGARLGLSLAKSIVEAHQGKFYYDWGSQNARFVLKLALKQK